MTEIAWGPSNAGSVVLNLALTLGRSSWTRPPSWLAGR